MLGLMTHAQLNGCVVLSNDLGGDEPKIKVMCVCTSIHEVAVDGKTMSIFCSRCRTRTLGEIRRFVHSCRLALRKLRQGRPSKIKSYTLDDFNRHFGIMTTDYGRSDLSVDHIRPLSVLGRLGLRDVEVANSLDNLALVDIKVNHAKSARCDPVEVVSWLEHKGHPVN